VGGIDMDRETIIKLAREAGLFTHKEVQPEIEAFAKLVAEHERYECAKVAEDTDRMVLALLSVTSQHKHIAAAIRARGNT
jgi:hypothetical protein